MIFVLNSQRVFQNFLSHINGLPLNGTWQVEIKDKKSSRSSRQNAYFHYLRDLLAKEIGYEKEELKHVLKARFLEKRKAVFNGDDVEYVPDTSSLNVKEFSNLIEKTQALCMHFEIQYPSEEYFE